MSIIKNRPRLSLILCAIGLPLLLAACGGGDKDRDGNNNPSPQLTTYDAVLSGAEEVPAITSSAAGNARFVIDLTTGAMSGAANFSGIASPTVAHIHEAAAGATGNPIITLTVSGNTATVPAGTVLSAARLQALQNGNLYVNIHSSANPTGEIRGQIGRIVRFATLSGDQEVPAVTTTATGSGGIVVDPATGAISGSFSFSNLTPTVAHIHEAAAGATGNPIITLTVSGNTATVPAGTVLSAARLQALQNGNLYVNIHSSANPTGEIRGQIGNLAGTTTLSGTQEVPPVTTSATGSATIFVDPVTNVVFGGADFSGIASPTVAHIHEAAAGATGNPIIALTVSGNTATVPAGTVLTTAQLQALQNGNLYVNIHSSANPTGEIRGQLSLQYSGTGGNTGGGPAPQPTAATLTSIQNAVFTPTCAVSGCHSGASAPAGLRLDPGFSHSNLVNVPSPGNASLIRVVPGSADTSFLIHKLEGTQTQGGRMPLFGTPLAQSTIDQIRSWIDAGALNN